MNIEPGIIALGASAGGLESLREFFTRIPETTGFAYIVVQHLSPNFKSLMDEILSKCTNLPVHRIDGETALAPNAIYLAPPKSHLTVNGSEIVASPLNEAPSPPHVIDSLFESLAKDRGSDAVGIILSGTGSDGMLGAMEIIETGGTVFAQSPETCKFDGMPQSAIRAKAVSSVLSVPEMVERLVTLSQEWGKRKHYELRQADPVMQQIIAVVRSRQGIDFSNYRFSTIGRRIERRMRHLQMNSAQLYVQELQESETETAALTRELLIGVTGFFRDQDAFSGLADNVVPLLFDRCEDECLRVWVAGCSTGEEAISIAVILYEYIVSRNLSKTIKIFATDVNRSAIEYATAATYGPEQLRGFPPSKIETYFNLTNGSFCLKPFIRRLIIYSVHNVATDPPFTRVDLLSCRNVLIYLQNELQERVLHQFLFALKMGGILFLGKCEQPNHASTHLETLDNPNRIYQKTKPVDARSLPEFTPSHLLGTDHSTLSSRMKRQGVNLHTRADSAPSIEQTCKELLERFVPCGALVNTNLELVHLYGSANELLKIPPGKTTLDLTKMLPDPLALAVSTASSTAIAKNTDAVVKNIQVQLEPDAPVTSFMVSMAPSPRGDKAKPKYLLVMFTETSVQQAPSATKSDTIEIDQSTQASARIRTLEEQLASTRDTLQNAIEELETANEELQSTNEELMSSNEELQSSNEELHSVNEELYTVNSEYQSKITELSKANKDIDFLLRNSRIGMVFLDRQLRIQRFNQNISTVISLLPHDVGRPLTDLQFNFCHKELMEAIHEVSEGQLSQRNLEIVDRGRSFMVTIAIFSCGDDDVLLAGLGGKKETEEIIVSFIDISLTKEAEQLRTFRNQSEELAYHILAEVRAKALMVLQRSKDHTHLDMQDTRTIQKMTEMGLTMRKDRAAVQTAEICSLRRAIEDCIVHERVAAQLDSEGAGPMFFVRRDLFTDTISQVALAYARDPACGNDPVRVSCKTVGQTVRIRFHHPRAKLDNHSLLRLFQEGPGGPEDLKPDVGIAVYSARSLGGDLLVSEVSGEAYIDFLLPASVRVQRNEA
jgi:two-component system CheB/CheR fusion protein